MPSPSRGGSLQNLLRLRAFSTQIREASDPVLHETLVCDFSTTMPEIRTAGELVLMDTYSTYFDCEMDCLCGIPAICTHQDCARLAASTGSDRSTVSSVFFRLSENDCANVPMDVTARSKKWSALVCELVFASLLFSFQRSL
jgi:Domain of unknown function (DUF4419)